MTLIYQVIRTTMRFVASHENCHLCNPLVVNNSGVVSVIHSSQAAFHMQRNMHVSIFKKCSSWRISECFKHLPVLIENFKYLFCLLCVHNLYSRDTETMWKPERNLQFWKTPQHRQGDIKYRVLQLHGFMVQPLLWQRCCRIAAWENYWIEPSLSNVANPSSRWMKL